MILEILLACAGKDESTAELPPCPSPMNDGWAPEVEDEVRLSEADAVWTASKGVIFDPVSQDGCVTAPCLVLTGPGEVQAAMILNRGVTYHLTATFAGTAGSTLRIVQTQHDGLEMTVTAVELTEGPVAFDFVLEAAGTGAAVVLSANGGEAMLDDLRVTGPQWALVEGSQPAPLRLGFLIHVEEDQGFVTDEATWSTKAEVLARLSALLATHGARLTVQPDATFVRGAALFDPGWIDERAAEGMGWSAHLHDEADGVSGFEQAARDARRGFTESHVVVDDVNGGFDLAAWSTLRDVGYRSLSAFKNPDTQLGLTLAFTTPWRPPDGAGASDEVRFETHDPDGPLVFLPGMGTREADTSRFVSYASRILSQVRTHTRPDFVNSWYFIDHVDAYGPLDDPAALQAWIDAGELDVALAPYETFLTTVVDPLVATGDVTWSTPSDMAFDYLDWEADCSP
jgi:hypothetical protein